jgi:Tol biopolymer transport system component
MHNLREVFEMVTKQTEPDLDSWKKQEDRQRQRSRNRRIGAIVVFATAAVGVGLFVLGTRSGDGDTPVSPPPTPLPIVTTPPIGAQMVGLDGSPLVQLPTDLAHASSVQLSPDGTTIAYMDTDGSVHTAAINGTNDRTLAGAGNTNDGDAQNHVAWSPDGTHLVYAFSGSIFVMNADGSGQMALTNDATGKVGDFYPVWSSTGSIAYWRGSNAGGDGGPSDAEIYSIPADGSGAPTRLTNDGNAPVSDIEPAWSPDGSKLSYFHGGELWVMRADGSPAHRLFSGSGYPDAWASAWSPDGSTIAVLHCCTQVGSPPLLSVFVVDVRSGESRRVGRNLDVATDGNGVQWLSNDTLLINRYH